MTDRTDGEKRKFMIRVQAEILWLADVLIRQRIGVLGVIDAQLAFIFVKSV
ncbi:hypothetical protein [Sedimentitalea nanhaiensis]|uniref:hypothetical protein n=1 Tax=Sedimentitalea nanhaiensis TaxID=999627 RepID=UPI0012B61E9C|nr:hypothetical protein [Sedimentitalea nanhaiensis]